MRNGIRCDLSRRDRIVALVGGEEPGFLQQRNRAAHRAADVIEVEVGIRVFGLKGRGREFSLTNFIVESPGGEGGVLVVVKRRTVIVGTAALGGDADVSDSCVLGAEI